MDDQDEFNWYLRSVTFSAGDEIELVERGLCLLVGPNSSGKSSALRGIAAHLRQDSSSRVVSSVNPQRAGSADSLVRWLDDRFPTRTFGGNQFWSTKGNLLSRTDIPNIWGQGPLMPGAWPFLVHLLDTDSRLSASKRTRSINVYEQAPEQYVHVLQSDDELARRISSEVQEAFQQGIQVEWTAGPEVGFRVGPEPRRTVAVDRVSPEYAQALLELPQLDEEGDGLRSFVGALLAVRCGAHPVLLIDEPEAFLHPPQARRLGRVLARAARESSRQVIVATHSADVVRGALDEGSDVSVCRVTRTGDFNRASLLPPAQLRDLWSKPLLRSVSAISGLFHRGVVVCEADADVRFYELTLGGMETRGEVAAPTDVYFAQGGGKGELATLAAAYRSVQVPVAVVADLDLLRNRTELTNVLKALGSDLAPNEGRYTSLLSNLRALPPRKSPADFIAGVQGALATIDASQPAISADVRRALSGLIDDAADWSAIKRSGLSLLRGAALSDAQALLSDWAQVGLFLVPVGELEGWWPAGPIAKRDWIDQALEGAAAGRYTGSVEFIRSVAGFLQR